LLVPLPDAPPDPELLASLRDDSEVSQSGVEMFVGLRSRAPELAPDVLGVEHRLGVYLPLPRDLHPPVQAELFFEVPLSVGHQGLLSSG
jgi:hypothetical protein